jgi:hypothetical protein
MLYFDAPSRTHNDVTVILVAVGLYLAGALRCVDLVMIDLKSGERRPLSPL